MSGIRALDLVKDIKRYIRLNLEDKIDQILKDRKKTSLFSVRDIKNLSMFMMHKNKFSIYLMKFTYIKSDYRYCFVDILRDFIEAAMQHASSTGNIDMLRFLLSHEMIRIYPKACIDLSLICIRALQCACFYDGSIETVKILLSDEIRKLYPGIDTELSKNMSQLLYDAETFGYTDIFRFLLELPNKKRKNFYSLINLHFDNIIIKACNEGHIDIVKLLLRTDMKRLYPQINPSAQNNYAIKCACHSGWIDIVKFLLSHEIRELYPQINPSTEDNRALIYACQKGHLDIVKFLLSHEIREVYPSIDPSVDGNSPIRYACEKGHIDIVKFLLSREIRELYPSIDPSVDFNLPIRCACGNGHIEVVKFLLSDKITEIYPSIDSSDFHNCALIDFLNNGHSEIVKILSMDKRVFSLPYKTRIDKLLENII